MPRFWVIFDIGLSSSFEKLFTWLDDQHAIECGENAATFVSEKPYGKVALELRKIFRNGSGGGSRIYLIGKPEGTTHDVGRFVVGRRKAPAWSGFGSTSLPDEGDEG
jgi:hypothetical protein